MAMLHAGVRCALPARQVLFAETGRAETGRAETGRAPDHSVCLWADPSPERAMPASHRVRLSTGSGAEWLDCASPRLVELDRERVWALPDFLVQILDMPCLIGLAEIEGNLHWVVDAHRLTNLAPGS